MSNKKTKEAMRLAYEKLDVSKPLKLASTPAFYVPDQLPPPELPPIEVGAPEVAPIKATSTGSYFGLDLSLAFKLIKDMDPIAFKIFAFLSLRAWGWDGETQKLGDGTVRASVSYLSTGTGLSHKAVFDRMQLLLSNGYIKKRKVDYAGGNVYAVAPLLVYFRATSNRGSSQAPTSNRGTNILGEQNIFIAPIEVAPIEVPLLEVASDWTDPPSEFYEVLKKLDKLQPRGVD